MLYIETILETMPYGKTKPVKVKAIGEYNRYDLRIDTLDVGDIRIRKHNSRNTENANGKRGDLWVRELVEFIPTDSYAIYRIR